MKRTGQKVVATDHPIDILRDRMGTKATTLLLAHLSAALKSNRHSYILPTIVFFHLIIGNIVFLLFTSSGALFIFALFCLLVFVAVVTSFERRKSLVT